VRDENPFLFLVFIVLSAYVSARDSATPPCCAEIGPFQGPTCRLWQPEIDFSVDRSDGSENPELTALRGSPKSVERGPLGVVQQVFKQSIATFLRK
jgi:hypothetical protein